MKTVAIIDPTSMVGCAVYNALKDRHHLLLIYQEAADMQLLDKAYGNVQNHVSIPGNVMGIFSDFSKGFSTSRAGKTMSALSQSIGDADEVINCMTVVKPHLLEDPSKTFFINAGLPHVLSQHFGHRLIHLSTDCVFDGLSDAPYTEDSPVNPTDFYGFSRSLGEPYERSLVIRASTIGPEIHNFDSLIAWVKKQAGQEIKSFTHHLWNGITTRQYAHSVQEIIDHRADYPDHGLFHIFGSDVSKFDLVTDIANKYEVDVTITPDDGPVLDRRLRTKWGFCSQLNIPEFSEMMAAL